MKRVLSFILVLSMVLGSMGMAFAAPTGNTAIDKMVELGFVKGDEGTGDLRLNDTIKRSEVAAIVTRVLGLEGLANSSNYQGRFTDVTPAHWANGSVNVAAGKNLVKGYENGTFLPEGNITNNEAVTIMVRMLLSAEEIEKVEKAGVWPSNYLTKAAELGILKNVNIANYGEAAVRENVFTIAYNAYETIAEEDLHVVKAIVLENDRVERIGANEVVVEVLKEVVKADFVTESRKDKDAGAQLRITLPEGFDAENLLGKVVDIAFDKTDAIVRIVEDTNYKVVTGAVKAEDKKLTVDGKAYTVSLDERYEAKDDRVYRTYYNNKAVAYKDFYQGLVEKDAKRADKFETDYARVTIHNGKVVLIDAYQFEDIAPVQEVKKDGAEVVAYNDARDGAVKKFELKSTTKVLLVEEGQMTKATMADIKANDVIHAFNGGYVVRRDAAVNGTFNKVVENKDGVFVQVDGKDHKVLTTANKKPVYSFDSKDFSTLEAKDADRVLREFRDEKVTVLVDVNGNLQYIGSEIEIGEFVALITNIVGRDIRVVKADGTKAEYAATLDTKVYNETGHQKLNELKVGDLVYMSVDGEKIDVVTKLANDNVAGTLVEKNVSNEYKLTKNLVELVNGKEYKILDRTNIFVNNGKVTEGTTIENLLKNYNDKKDVKVFVFTDKNFTDANVGERRSVSNRDDVAHTIIFTDIDYKLNLDYDVAEILDIYTLGRDYELKLRLENENVTRTVKRDSAAWTAIADKDVKIGDVVKAGISKDDAKVVSTLAKLIDKNEPTYGVTDFDSRTGYRTLKLVDKHGVAGATMWTTRNVTIFGSLDENSVITYHKDVNGEIDVIFVKGNVRNTAITASYSNMGDLDGLTFDSYLGGNRVVLSGKRYTVVGNMDTFFNTNQDVLAGAKVAVDVDGGEIIAIRGLVLNVAGTLDGTIGAPRKMTINGDIIVNANNVILKDLTANKVYKHATTLTLNNVIADEVVVVVGGGTTLNLAGNTEVKTVTVNAKEVVDVESGAKVTTAIVVNADQTTVQGTGIITKVTVNAADVVVPAGVVTEVKAKPEVANTVTKAVYNTTSGKFDVTFTVETKNATKVEKVTVDTNGDVTVVATENVADNKVIFTINDIVEPTTEQIKVRAVYEVGNKTEVSEVSTITIKDTDFPKKK